MATCRSRRLPGAVLLAVALAAAPARAGAPGLALPDGIPAAERARLLELARSASVAANAQAEPFVARREVFEFLLDHPEFATHVTRALRLARYRIWRDAEGLWLDDGWGAVGRFRVVHAADGTRVMYARGRYQPRILPSIQEHDAFPEGGEFFRGEQCGSLHGDSLSRNSGQRMQRTLLGA